MLNLSFLLITGLRQDMDNDARTYLIFTEVTTETLTLFSQKPPLRQGLDSHSFTSISHLWPT